MTLPHQGQMMRGVQQASHNRSHRLSQQNRHEGDLAARLLWCPVSVTKRTWRSHEPTARQPKHCVEPHGGGSLEVLGLVSSRTSAFDPLARVRGQSQRRTRDL